MNAHPKSAAYAMGVSRRAFDVQKQSRLIKGVALAYAVVALGLAAHLVFSDGTPSWGAAAPAVSRPAIDPEALTVGLRLDDESDTGAGYLEFASLPTEPQGTVGLSHAPVTGE